MPLSTTYTLQINGSNVHVTLKRMKSIRLQVKSTGEVTLSAPLGTSKARISEFVRSKADWIRTQQAKQVDSPAARAERASREEIEQWRTVVKACVPPLVAEWERILGVRVQKLDYRNMKSRGGEAVSRKRGGCVSTFALRSSLRNALSMWWFTSCAICWSQIMALALRPS